MKSFLAMGLALASCAAFSAVTQNFDGAELPKGWSGDGSVADGKLSVNGTVTCTNTGTASEWSKSLFVVKAPADGSDEMSTEGLSDCQIAVATGAEAADTTKLKVMVYQGSTTGWVDSGKTVGKAAWFSVGLEFDYANGKVKVAINGDAIATPYNVVTPQAASSKIASLAFVGTADVDDVSIQEAVATSSLPDLKGMKIYAAEQGLTDEAITANAVVGESGLTVQEKLQAGLDPTDSSTFTAQAIAQGSITVPCAYDNGQVYKIKITGTDVRTVDAKAGAIAEGKRTLTFTMPTDLGRVLKFEVIASAPVQQS